jgi:hypothetical protein
MEDLTFTLNIQNNVNYPIDISILGNPYNALDTANAKTEYQWNLTGISFANNENIILQYQSVGSLGFLNYDTSYQGNTIQDIVNALNNLNIGYFSTYTIGGNTYISTYNDDYVFGNLTINGAIYPPIFNPSFIQGSGFDNRVTWIKNYMGGVLIAGKFTTYNGSSAQRLVKLFNNGTIDLSFNTSFGFNNGMERFFIDSANNVFCTGNFTAFGLVGQNQFAKLDSNATIDLSYNTGAGYSGTLTIGSGSTNDVVVDGLGNVYIVGNFDNYNGNPINGINKTNNLGAFDNTFAGNIGAGFNNPPTSIAIASDGNFIVTGEFTLLNGNPRNRIVKLLNDGTEDVISFGAGFNGNVFSIYCYTTGEILVGGAFTTYDGTPNIRGIVRLTSIGSIDVFDIGTGASAGFTGGVVIGFDVDETSGKIVVTGNFTAYNGTPCNGIIRLNGDGTIDNTWNYGTGISGGSAAGYDAQLLLNNTYLLGGDFTSFDGNSVNNIVSLLD